MKNTDYEAIEREHLGDHDKQPGIYAIACRKCSGTRTESVPACRSDCPCDANKPYISQVQVVVTTALHDRFASYRAMESHRNHAETRHWAEQYKLLCADLIAALCASQPSNAVQDAPTVNDWTDWPDGTGVGGYYFTKENDASPVHLVHIKNSTHFAIELWECPGIGRQYVNHVTERRYKGVQLAAPAAIDVRDAALKEAKAICVDQSIRFCEAMNGQAAYGARECEAAIASLQSPPQTGKAKP